MNFNQLNKIFNKYNKVLGNLSHSQYSYSIYRPVYTAADQIGSVVASSQNIRVDSHGESFAEPRITGASYFDIFLNRDLVQPGDVLVPSTISPNSPIVTIAHISPMKACVGFLSDRLGKICEGTDTLYDNVRFSWVGPSYPGSGLNDRLEASLKISSRKALLFTREGVGLTNAMTEGLRLIETNNDKNYSWIITDVTTYNSYMVLGVVEDTI